MAAPSFVDMWRDFGEVRTRLAEAFPSSSMHAAIARRWLMRRPANTWEHCPACGQPRADALGRPQRHHLTVIVAARPVTTEPPVLRFDRADWSLPPQRLDAFFRSTTGHWLCGECAASIALAFLPADEVPLPDRVFADLTRALAESPLFEALERWRAGSTPAVMGFAVCEFCRAERRAFLLPWFQMCDRCAAEASSAPAIR